MARIGLFVPCYIDQCYPQVGIATCRLLRRLGHDVQFPREQTCCGQPCFNSGLQDAARPLAERFVRIFADFDQVVAPSGSCVAMVRQHFGELLGENADYRALRGRVFELCEFLHRSGVALDSPRFPHRVALHQSCHGLRDLGLGRPSEHMREQPDLLRELLQQVDGLELVEPERADECCGFGGTFAVFEEAMSCAMGRDRLDDFQRAGAEVLTAGDMSCLMHFDGLVRREARPLRIHHIAEILAGTA